MSELNWSILRLANVYGPGDIYSFSKDKCIFLYKKIFFMFVYLTLFVSLVPKILAGAVYKYLERKMQVDAYYFFSAEYFFSQVP